MSIWEIAAVLAVYVGAAYAFDWFADWIWFKYVDWKIKSYEFDRGRKQTKIITQANIKTSSGGDLSVQIR